MRPASVSDEEIIEAGNGIASEGKPVNGAALRLALGTGRPERLMKVWRAHVETSGAVALVPVANELPLEIEDALKEGVDKQAEFLRTLAFNLQRVSSRLAERRVIDAAEQHTRERTELQAELSDSNRLIDELSRTIDALTEQQDNLAVQAEKIQDNLNNTASENAQLLERIAGKSDRITELEHQVGTLRSANSKLEMRATEAERRAETLESQLRSTEHELTNLKTSSDAVSDTLIERTKLLAIAEEKIKGHESRVTDLLRENEHQRLEISRGHDTTLRLGRHNDSLQAMIERLEQEVAHATKARASEQSSDLEGDDREKPD